METDHSTPRILGQPRHIHGKLHTITQSNTEATKARPSDLDSPGVKKRLEPRLGRFDPGQHLIKLMFLDCRQLAAKERAFQRFPLPPVLAGRSKAPAIAQCFAELLCGESDPTCLFQLLPHAHCKHQTEGWFLVNSMELTNLKDIKAQNKSKRKKDRKNSCRAQTHFGWSTPQHMRYRSFRGNGFRLCYKVTNVPKPKRHTSLILVHGILIPCEFVRHVAKATPFCPKISTWSSKPIDSGKVI